MKYTEYKSHIKLQDIIHKYWKFEVFEDNSISFPINHNTLPENKISIVIINQPYFNGIRILGPHLKNYNQHIVPNSIFFGIKLQPWITIGDLIIDKVDLVNSTCNAPDKIKKYFQSTLSEPIHIGFNAIELIETALLNLFQEVVISSNTMVKYICLELDKGKIISEVINDIPMSTRVIQKKFKTTTGITMKQYANINRQRNTWKAIMLEKKNHLDAILDNGFFDQSHFINEFKAIMKRPHKVFKTYLNTVEIVIPTD